jgi:putative serine protease PepD
MTERKPDRSRNRNRDRPRWLPWAAVGGALVFLGIVGGIIAGVANSSASRASVAGEGASVPSSCDATTVAEQNLPSVVTIQAKAGNGAGAGTGSGEVIRTDGYIMTNNHVIAIAASGGAVDVVFSDGSTVPATIVGRDPQTDLAVLKVDPSAHSLRAIPMGDSSSVVVGQGVVVLGAPLGLTNTVTTGIVSALDRTIQVPAENDTAALLVSAVQTDAAINPGNSGGAMLNCAGQLIGVPSAGATVPSASGEPSSGGSIGLGFAIPVDLATTVTSEIIDTGTVTHAFFGLVTLPVPGTAEEGAVPQGLFVRDVVPGGPSAKAGLRPGDVITSINGQPATSNVQLQEITLTSKPGSTVDLEYTRNGSSATATVTLGTMP